MVRFVDWVRNNPDQHESLSVLFTPWGEGLTRSWYRDAMVTLSRVSHVERVAIQTNLAGRLTWLSEADPSRVALWATYHPGEVLQDRFLGQCATLDRMGIRYSVGVVGLPEHLEAARRMRSALPASVYLWVNAADGYDYDAVEEAAWTELDPHFGFSVRPHASLGHECWAGETVVSVQGDGTVRRCHFIPAAIGNLYDGSYRGPAAAESVRERGLRLPHRVRPPQTPRAARTLRGRAAGTDPDLGRASNHFPLNPAAPPTLRSESAGSTPAR